MYRRVHASRVFWQRMVIIAGALQFILHFYFVIALRISNQELLNNAALEEQWGFGQILALIMLGATLLECAKALEGRSLCHFSQYRRSV